MLFRSKLANENASMEIPPTRKVSAQKKQAKFQGAQTKKLEMLPKQVTSNKTEKDSEQNEKILKGVMT